MDAKRVEESILGNAKPSFIRVAECLYRYSNNGMYYALVKRHGKQIRKSLGTSEREWAGRELAVFRAKVGRLANLTKDSGTTFMKLAEKVLAKAKTRLKPDSARNLAFSIKKLNKHFGIKPVQKITTAHCDDWAKKRGEKVGASSFNHDRAALIGVLKYAIDEKLIMENPALTIARRKVPKNQISIPSKDQFLLMVKTIRAAGPLAQKGANLVELLACSGMRVSEATSLLWGDVDFDGGRFVVTGGSKGTKNHEARSVPLFPSLRLLLERLKADLGKEPNRDERVISMGSARRAINNACRRANLPRCKHHFLRHFFVSQAIEVGVDFKTIAAWVGHKDGGMLVSRTYGHLRDSHSVEMAQKMTFGVS